MAMENHLHSEGGISLDKWTSKLNQSETKPSVGFDCNICLDLVQDPVVTFCGHLYCWPCIYRWIRLRHTSLENTEPQCPVCKAGVSTRTLIPLYGRGQDSCKDDKDPRTGCPIPQRPPSYRSGGNNVPRHNATSNHSYPVHQLHHRNYGHPLSHRYNPRNGTDSPMLRTCLVDPMIGVFGEMVYARIFGNSENTLYAYPNSYNLAGISSSSSPSLRRHMMQIDESLGRIYFFLCCCVMLCLLLF